MSNKRKLLFFLIVLKVTGSIGQGTYNFQPDMENRTVDLLHVDQLTFKDLNKNQKLDVYEDWRKPIDSRIEDLLDQMTVEEKVGMLLINTLNAGEYGLMTDQAVELIEKEKMTRFVFRNSVTQNPVRSGAIGNGFRGVQITPFEAAQFMNSVQEVAESTRLGIPLLFKSNARNHISYDARAGINVEAGAFSSWPKESGLAATRDMELIADFGKIMAKEWTALGSMRHLRKTVNSLLRSFRH
jgi:beta-glucosidase